MNNTHNPEKKGLVVGLVILFIASVVLLIPVLADQGILPLKVDMMGAGYAIMCFAGFGLLMGVVIAVVYGMRMATLNKILEGGQLAHWVYGDIQFEQHQEKDYREASANRKVLFIVTSVLILVIGGIIFIPAMISGDIDSPWWLIGFYCLIPVLAFFAFVLPARSYGARHGRPREVYIADAGLYQYGQLHPFRSAISKLVQVKLKEGAEPALAFTIRTISSVGVFHFEHYTVEAPVPAGQIDTARQIVQHFGMG